MEVFNKQDVDQNKIMGILSYCSLLVLVPIFAGRKDSEYTRFHARQGFTLALMWVAAWIIFGILGAIVKVPRYFLGVVVGYTSSPIITILGWVVNVGILVLAIFGIINACQGTKKEIPLVGSLDLLSPLGLMKK